MTVAAQFAACEWGKNSTGVEMSKTIMSIAVAVILIIMAYTWSSLCLDAGRFVEVPERFITIGQMLLAAAAGGVVGNKIGIKNDNSSTKV